MGIAFATVGSGVSTGLQMIFAPLSALVSFFAPWKGTRIQQPSATKYVANYQSSTLAYRHFDEKISIQAVAGASFRRPVRVLRVADGSAPRHSAGRMVISGRMADVCAELDRLASDFLAMNRDVAVWKTLIARVGELEALAVVKQRLWSEPSRVLAITPLLSLRRNTITRRCRLHPVSLSCSALPCQPRPASPQPPFANARSIRLFTFFVRRSLNR